MAALFAQSGHFVYCIDKNINVLESLHNGTAPVGEPGLQELVAANKSRLWPVKQYAVVNAVANSEWAFIIVPTPSNALGAFSNEYVLQALQPIGLALKDGARTHVVVTCTVSPKSCDDVLIPKLQKISGKCAGIDFGFSYAPHFIALGSVIANLRNPDFILIGSVQTRWADELADFYYDLHGRLGEPRPKIAMMNLVNAEITKLSLNCAVTQKISLANQIGTLCEHIPGADAHVVCKAIGLDQRIGPKYLTPSVPYGGPCFVRDQRAMQAAGLMVGIHMPLSHATDQVNEQQLAKFAQLIMDCNPEQIAILGLSYKVDTPVTDESVATRLIPLLSTITRRPINLHDPEAISLIGGDQWDTPQRACQDADVILIATAWPQYRDIRPEWIKPSALILDLWNVLDGRDDFRTYRRWVPGKGFV